MLLDDDVQATRPAAFRFNTPNVHQLRPHKAVAMVDAYDGRCAYCDKPGAMTIEHIEAVSRGGEHTLSNVAPACKRCNMKKNAKPLADALTVLGVSRVDFLKRRGLALFRMLRPNAGQNRLEHQ
jgi:5-methylcytosine-specific restriction endonuclease McrA